MNSQTFSTPSASIQQDYGATESYALSFIDALTGYIKRLPVPFWFTYMALFVAESALTHIFAWMDGWLPAFKFEPLLVMFPLWLWGPLAVITYLNSISEKALATFSPLLDADLETIQVLKREFTTMPSRNVTISSILWSVFYVAFVYAGFDTLHETYGFGVPTIVLLVVEGFITYSIGSVIYYHSIRQIRLVNRAVKIIKKLDLFHLDPVYAFSIVTSRTGITWVALLTVTLFFFPIQTALVPMLSLLVLQAVLALSAFALPLVAVNQLLVAEKRRLLADHNRYVEETLERLHRHLDDNEMAEAAVLKEVILGLNAERDILDKIPTWPWRPGLLTGFLSVIVLPVILFLVQLALGRWLGR